MPIRPRPPSRPSARFPRPLAALLLAGALSGCATTRITADDPYAEIYMNSRFVGVGEARVDRIGPPKRVTLEAKKGGRVIGSTEMSRSFTFQTLLWGAVSYYTGFFWGWYFPESVRIPIVVTPEGRLKIRSLWQDPRQSEWMQPLQ